jgi:hypothetical protein
MVLVAKGTVVGQGKGSVLGLLNHRQAKACRQGIVEQYPLVFADLAQGPLGQGVGVVEGFKVWGHRGTGHQQENPQHKQGFFEHVFTFQASSLGGWPQQTPVICTFGP